MFATTQDSFTKPSREAREVGKKRNQVVVALNQRSHAGEGPHRRHDDARNERRQTKTALRMGRYDD